MPTNPYVSPSQQTKVHNTVISNLETVVDTNKYDILMHYFTTTGGGSNTFVSQTVATVSNGVHSDASGFGSDIVQLRNTKKFSDAITDGTSGGLHQSTLTSHTRHVSGIPSSTPSWTNKTEADSNVNSQMSSSNSAIFNFEVNGESCATAYSNLCDDGYTGSYIVRRQFNCYHNYNIIYVR